MSGIRDRLRKEGYNEDEILEIVKPLEAKFMSEGYGQEEINDILGKPQFDDSELKDFSENLGNDLPEEAQGIFDSFQAGYQASASGLIKRGELPDVELPGDANFSQRLSAGLGGIAGDVPFMVGGAIAGGVSGGPLAPVTAVAGAFALPAGARKVMVDSYEKGEIDDPQEFLSRLNGSMIETAKGYATGVATATAGIGAGVGLAKIGATNSLKMIAGPKTAEAVVQATKLGAEVTAMTSTMAAFEGRLPTKQEFVDAAVLLGGVKMSVKTAGAIKKKAGEVFHRTGKRPSEVVRDAQRDQTIKEDILGDREVPRAYKEFAKDSEAGYSPKQKANLPENKILEKLSILEKSKKKPTTADEVYTAIVDDLHPLKKFTEAVTQGKKLPADKDPYIGARVYKGVNGKVKHFLEFGTFEHKTLKVDGPSLKKIMEPVGKDIDSFRAYIVAKRAQEFQQKGKVTGLDPKDIQATIGKFDSKYAESFENLKAYNSKLTQFMVDSGVLSKESKSIIEAANKDYIPMYRVLDKDLGGKAGEKAPTVFNPIRTAKGSTKDIVDPLESIIKNTYAFVSMAERNAVAKSLVELRKLEGGENFIKPVSRKLKKVTVKQAELQKVIEDAKGELDIFRPEFNRLGKGEIVVFEKGKAKIYEVDPTVAEIFGSLGREHHSILVQMMSKPASALRAGITLSPDFMVKNLLRDNVLAGIQSKNNFIPFVDGMRGLASIAKQDASYQAWLRSGGANAALVSMDRAYMQDSLYKILQSGKIRNQVERPLEFLRVASEISDSMSRVGEFRKAMAGKPQDMANLTKAAFDAREVSLDFARKGAQMAALNQMAAFTNAKIGGVDRFARAMSDNPKRTGAKIAGYIMLPTALLWWANKDDKRYKDLPQWEKDMYWHVLTDDNIYRIPKPFEPGILFGGGTERFLDMVNEKDPHAFDGLLSETSLFDMNSFLPTAITPFISNYTNKSLFTGGPIVPADREGLLPKYQYKPGTSELLKSASAILTNFTDDDTKQLTPLAIENFVRSWTGSLGTTILSVTDYTLRKAGVLPDPSRPAKTFEEMPVVKAFMVKYPKMTTRTMEEFYKKYNRNEKTIKTFKKLLKEEGKIDESLAVFRSRQQYFSDLSASKRSISNLAKFARWVEYTETLTPEEKRQAIDSAYFQANKIAEAANQKADIWEDLINQQKKETK